MIEPKSTLECMHFDAFHQVSRKNELLKLKKLGFVKKVKIVPDDECRRIKRFKKIYNIEEVPELPLTGRMLRSVGATMKRLFPTMFRYWRPFFIILMMLAKLTLCATLETCRPVRLYPQKICGQHSV